MKITLAAAAATAVAACLLVPAAPASAGTPSGTPVSFTVLPPMVTSGGPVEPGVTQTITRTGGTITISRL